MIIITNPLMLPCSILLASLDAYLWLFCLQAILRKTSPAGQFSIALTKLTEPILNIIQKMFPKKDLSDGIQFAIAIGMLFLIRCVVTIIVNALMQM